MIENREQRKASSLLRRRKIAILVTLLIVAILVAVLAVVYNYVNTVIPYYDVDDTEYHIKEINGLYFMYDKRGNLLPQDNEFGYYRTAAGTLLLLDETTGEIKERVIPDFYDPSLSETVDHQKILIFPNLESKNISAINVYNSYEPEGFTLMRYDTENMVPDNSSDFVLMYKKLESTMLALNKELVASLYVSAGYALAMSKIDPAEVEEHGFAEYGLLPETRTRTGWYYHITVTVDGTEHEFNVNFADGKFLDDETVKDSTEPAYDMKTPTGGITAAKAIMLAANTFSPENSDKLKYNVSLRVYEQTYEYTPAFYVIVGADGSRHKMIIGDRLINGNGYYAQYVDAETGEKRNTVYTLPATIADTLLAPAKTLVASQIVYSMTANDYFDVADFTISKKADGTIGNYNEIVSFSYIDLNDRTQTVEGIHPYFFTDGAFKGYRPNYDNIDRALSSLMKPTINEISVLSPTAQDKIAYGIAKPLTDEDGKLVYDADGNLKCVYDAKHKITFYRTHIDDTGEKHKFLQTVYVSAKNADGNFYTYTIIDFPEAKISLDMICEVSAATLDFLTWDEYSWVYPNYLQIGITYTESINITLPEYSIDFDVINSKVNNTNTLQVATTDSSGRSFTTFGVLDFKDRHGNRWIITPEEITVFDAGGKEIKPSSRHFEDNSIGEQVRVINEQVIAEDGRRISVSKDYIDIVYLNGQSERLLRYHNSIFKKLFLLVTGVSIVDSYDITPEEEAALIADRANFVASVTVKDTEGGEIKVEYYTLTARKIYIKVNGSGGFYVSTSHVKDSLSAIDNFLAGTDIDIEK